MLASALPLLGHSRLPRAAAPRSDSPAACSTAGAPEAGGAVARLWAWQWQLCAGAAAAFAALCSLTVAAAWPPPLAWACAASVRAPFPFKIYERTQLLQTTSHYLPTPATQHNVPMPSEHAVLSLPVFRWASWLSSPSNRQDGCRGAGLFVPARGLTCA